MFRVRFAAPAPAALMLFVLLSCDINNVINTSTNGNPQKWVMINDALPPETATVVITPFTNSGTFSETSSSRGWHIDYRNVGGPLIRIPLSGTVSHAGANDRWSFAMTIQQGSISLLGQGDGYSAGNFPNAVTASGTVHGTLRDPNAPNGQAVSGSWRAYRDNR